ncbi:MAG: T9SS type A sorting domain-containing protein [Bacteroidetes bacterium]|nr:T9SS type A sorting domain-containing protein [Bacteroidota bacterium]
MKKVLALCALVAVFLSGAAQQIPNGSFQYWAAAQAPNGWGTWASAIGTHNTALSDTAMRLAQRDTMAGYYSSDSSSLLLTVDTITLPGYGRVTLSGFAALGGASYVQPPTGTGLQLGYIPYTLRPDTLYLDYKATRPAGAGDMPVISVGLTRWDTLTHSRFELLSEAFTLPPDSAWQYNIAIPLIDYYDLSYADTVRPDSLQIIFFASGATYPTIGTRLWLDSVRFDASVLPVTTGLPDLRAIDHVAIWPNPATAQVYIGLEEKEVGAQAEMYDATGRKVYQGPLPDRINTVCTEALPAGDYMLRIRSMDGLTTYRSRVVVER